MLTLCAAAFRTVLTAARIGQVLGRPDAFFSPAFLRMRKGHGRDGTA